MNLVYELLNEEYKINYGEFHNLTIENVIEFRKIIESFRFHPIVKIYDGESLKNPETIIDIFNYDFQNKKIINHIIKDLSVLSNSELFIEEKFKLKKLLNTFINSIMMDYDIEIEKNDEISMEILLKSLGIRVMTFEKFIIRKYNKLFKRTD